MSELPWENKKIAEIMSSAGDEAKLSPDASKNKMVSNPPIPDILANAFADIPMEEAKIEAHEPASDVKVSQMPEMSFPSFGDLPDLSAVGENNSEVPTSNPDEMSFPPSLPSFMNAPNISGTPDQNEGVLNDIPKTLFTFDNSGIDDNSSAKTSQNSGASPKKRSPPPLFEPFIPPGIDAESGDGPEPPAINMPESAVNDSITFPAAVPSSENTSAPQINPFAAAPNVSANPFEAPPAAGVNPFDSTPAAGVNPFEASPAAGVNPFDSTPAAGINPFAAAPAVGANPFEAPPVAGANPFAAASTIGVNPFGEPFHGAETTFVKEKSGSKKLTMPPINVDSFKKNIEGMSVVAKGFFKNLTKGKSLIERMEDMRGETVSEVSLFSDDADSASKSPFENESDVAIAPSPVNPFSSLAEDPQETIDNAQVNPFEFDQVNEPVEAIRNVTPIDNPVMAMDPKYSLDENISHDPVQNTVPANSPDFLGVDDELMGVVPVGESVTSNASNGHGILPESSSEIPHVGEMTGQQEESELFDNILVSHNGNSVDSSRMSLSKILSAESNGMIADKRYDGIESDIDELKGNLRDMGMQFTSVRGEVENFSSKVSYLDETLSSFAKASEDLLAQDQIKFADIEEKTSSIEGKVDNFESNLAVIQSNNTSIKSDLSRLEDNVSELVNCYTALLAQLHESLQENESKFSRIDDVSGKLDVIGSRISSMEKSHEGTKSTSMEFSRSISSLIDNLGMVSSEFKEFRQESEQKNAAMLEKISSVTEYVESELKKLGAKSYKGFGQNVHLSNIVKNSGNMKLCMEWLEFLMGLVGRNNLPDILSYYEELGWITEKVRMELLHYADGIDFYMEKPDWKLTPDDHVKSIWFIESLAGMKVDKNRLSVIERDIEKVKKGSEIYGI
ncbi:FlaD/FlaE family flagellar protein [uncultured Methanolobus sp.]|uniref:FlaD/FlaE family flagellar protein n=1 Tax=uncultured Methanolobus sp. TaxID=218300 RepID=UPI0029C6571F|nr:FlaD/FlaE family flagellar protein [uncultured Methanolobus sp.]